MGKAKVCLIIIGVVSVVLASLGLLYNLTSFAAMLRGSFSEIAQRPDTQHFVPAYLVMSAICVGCFVLLIVCGVTFITGRTHLTRFFVILVIFMALYPFSIGLFWFLPGIGMSIGAATGVANGGLMLPILILFPVWGPLAAVWAARKVEAESSEPNS